MNTGKVVPQVLPCLIPRGRPPPAEMSFMQPPSLTEGDFLCRFLNLILGPEVAHSGALRQALISGDAAKTRG